MDSLNFDGYTSYSDASTPRTPSPTDMHFNPPHNVKHDMDQPIRGIFNTDEEHHGVPADNHYWPQPGANHNFSFNPNPARPRGSLLQELYEPDFSPDSPYQHHQQPNHNDYQRPNEFPMVRRATFPYVRHDREDGGIPLQQYPPFIQQQQQQHHQQQMLHHPHHPQNDLVHGYDQYNSYHEFDDTSIKLEDSSNMIVPPQPNPFYRPHSNSNAGVAGHPMAMAYLSPHTGLPVQHTDDAASKETQYLRRRCFNCHTTEPPSWRRSTLNPGKIVCNKCGLYERTHLRPRPLRFDELRAGNKARKASKGNAASVSPKMAKGIVKKEPREYGGGGLVRRSSVSSNSSVHSSSGASDWDDNVSIYSSGSAPPTSFNSPTANNFPLSRDSQSPPRDGGIRLPTNPLSDIASMHPSQQTQSTTPLMPPTNIPRKAQSSPGAFYSPSLNASTMPPLAENAVWSAEPEDMSANGSPLGLLPSAELASSS